MQLNELQQKAVETNSRNALVIAPPGSGKTRTIVERVAHLVENCKVSSYEICCITFTRLAATEMRERLEKRIGNEAHRLTIGTYHSIALNLLRRFGGLIGFTTNATVYSEWENNFLLKEVAKDLGLHNGKTWKKIKKKDIDAVFAKYYQEGVVPVVNCKEVDLFKAFLARCKENNSYTYGSLLTGMKLLLPEISKYLHWKHIIADEQQDADLLQWSLLEEIKKLCGASLFCVADLDQSIYSWRGACPEYLIAHQDEFDLYHLELNYRSGESIINAANSLIQYNKDRIPNRMIATRNGDLPISLEESTDSAGIVKLIKTLSIFGDDGQKAPVVLGRNHVLLKKLSSLLDEAGIQHTYIGKKTELTRSEEFRRFHAFLKLIVNPYDNFSFLLIKDLLGIDSKQYKQIRFKAVKEGKSHFQAWMDDATCPYSSFFWGSREVGTSLSSATFAVKYMATGAVPYPDKGWDFDVEEIFQFIFKWLADNPAVSPEASIQSYLDYLAVFDLQDEITEENQGVQLLTMHASKGLEFPVVIIAGMNEGILPSKQAVAANEIESERRLAYVATTRAEDKLIITVRPEKTESYGKTYYNPESRFVKEMGKGDWPKPSCKTL